MFDTRRLIVSVLGSSCLILAAPMARADRCPAGYDINRKIQITQGNGFTVNCQLRLSKGEVGPQTRGSFTGICESRGNASQEVHGFIDKNSRFKMQVDWNGGSVGVYTGLLNENGRLVDGRTFDATHPANWSDWRIQGSLPCK
jgi:hypothetical protein